MEKKRIRSILLFIALAGLTACSAAPTAEEQAQTAELAQLQSLKKTYSGVVMGFDIHNEKLDVSIDLQSMMEMDEDTEKQMVVDSLKVWRDAWTKAHPHDHATLVVRIIDFRGNQEFKETAKV